MPGRPVARSISLAARCRVGLLALTLLLASAQTTGAAPTSRPIGGGFFFAEAAGGGELGFAIVNDDAARLWDAYQRLGGLAALGYPASRRFVHDGFVTQVMQKAVLQWRPESGSVAFVNVFDDLTRLGRDDWLLAVRSTPRPLPPDTDAGKDWPTVVRDRTALLAARPAIQARYRAVPDPLQRYGLPTSRVEDQGSHYAIRLQRAVIQEWKVDVPWARAGETTVANGGDLMKEAGVLPPAALVPALPPAAASPAPPPLSGIAASPAPLPTTPPAPPTTAVGQPLDARVTSETVVVRSAPVASAGEVVTLFRNATVEVVGRPVDGSPGTWLPVRVWNGLDGYAPQAALTTEPFPSTDPARGGGYRRAIPANPVLSVALPIDAPARLTTAADLLDAPGGAARGRAEAGTSVRVVGYGRDATRTWLSVRAADQPGWVPAASIDIVARDPLAPLANGRPPGQVVAGKGMWATYDLLDRASPEAIVATARANGLSHIYLQVGRSNLGFYGARGLDRLLPAAHAAGIAIVGWVYPLLKDTAADVNLTVQVARYTTPDGHRIDALAADVEENLRPEEVHAYGQLVRALVGDDLPLIVATYPPDSANGRTYPFAIVARIWNVIAPMDYYHRPTRSYAAEEAHAYVARSIELIRQRSGRPVVVAPIGQAYGMQWPNEVGPTSPSGEETRAMLRAAGEAGAVGISFFEWAHATAPQWREIAAFAW